MQFNIQRSKPTLLVDIQEFHAQLIKYVRDDHPYMPPIFDRFMFSKGINTTTHVHILTTPYGVKSSDYDKDVSALIENTLCVMIGLKAMRVYDNYHVLTTDDELVGAYYLQRENGIYWRAFVQGPVEVVNAFKEALNHLLPENAAPVIRRLRLGLDSTLHSEFEALPAYNTNVSYHHFYPFLQEHEHPEVLWHDFAASTSNVLLLIGPPGTGKSSFIRGMLQSRGWDENIYLADHEDIIMHHHLADYIRDMPKGSVLVTEDSDKMVAKRSDGNHNMAALLNATNGIIPTDTKIIISTNLPDLRRVDDALLRPGRAFNVLKFRALTLEEAYALRDKMQLPTMELKSSTNELTLAETLNYNPSFKRQTHIGFVN